VIHFAASGLPRLRWLRRPEPSAVLGLALPAALALWLGANLIATPGDFVSLTLIGVTLGCVYALIALGYTLVYGILELINFAHGDVFMPGNIGFQLGLVAFTAAVLGGVGNLAGAVLGAVLIGLIESFAEGLSWHAPGSDWTASIVFSILILILVFRAQGLLGEQVHA